MKIPADISSANLRPGNHDVQKSNIMGGVYQDENNWRGDENKKQRKLCSVKLFNQKSQTTEIYSDSKNCMKEKRIANLDSSQQRSQEKFNFSGFSKRNFWPVPFQLFSPIVLKSLVGDKDRNYGGEHRKLGRQFLRLQKRNTQPINTLELISPTLKIYLRKWLGEDNAETIKRNQEPISYLSYCYIYMY